MEQVQHPVAKAGASAGLAALGYAPHELLSMVASILAVIYTTMMIIEWMYKRVYKPFAIRRGWKKGPHRDYLDSTGAMPLDEFNE